MSQMFAFSEILSEWKIKKEVTVKKSTMAAYNLTLNNHIIPFFSTVDSLNETQIQKFVDEKLKAGLSVKSIKDILVVVRMIIKFSNTKGYSLNEKIDIKFPKINNVKDLEVFNAGQQKILFTYLIENPSLKNLGILICLNTGLRIGEICALQWKDLDLKNKVLSVNKTLYRIYTGNPDTSKTELIIGEPKTRHSHRLIPIPDILLKKIMDLYPCDPKDKYLLTNTLKPLEPRAYRNYYKNLLISLQLPELKFHCLRHSFATRCIESDCDYKTVSAILGHADVATTMNLYVHPSYDQKKRCLEKMLESIR